MYLGARCQSSLTLPFPSTGKRQVKLASETHLIEMLECRPIPAASKNFQTKAPSCRGCFFPLPHASIQGFDLESPQAPWPRRGTFRRAKAAHVPYQPTGKGCTSQCLHNTACPFKSLPGLRLTVQIHASLRRLQTCKERRPIKRCMLPGTKRSGWTNIRFDVLRSKAGTPPCSTA